MRFYNNSMESTMQPTAILSQEHRVIEVVLNCLERIAAEALESGRLDRESAEQAVDFFKTFADGCPPEVLAAGPTRLKDVK